MYILLFKTSCFMSTCLSTQVSNAFKTAGVLRQLYKRGIFSHSGVISTEHGRSDLSSPVRHKTLLSPGGETEALSSRVRLRIGTLANRPVGKTPATETKVKKWPRQPPAAFLKCLTNSPDRSLSKDYCHSSHRQLLPKT